MIRRDGLAGRIAAIEAALAEPPPADQPLSRHELAELARLEADRAAMGPIEAMDAAGLDAFMSYQCGDHHSPAARLDHLRHRAMPPAERAALAEVLLAIDCMDGRQLDEFMERRVYG